MHVVTGASHMGAKDKTTLGKLFSFFPFPLSAREEVRSRKWASSLSQPSRLITIRVGVAPSHFGVGRRKGVLVAGGTTGDLTLQASSPCSIVLEIV